MKFKRVEIIDIAIRDKSKDKTSKRRTLLRAGVNCLVLSLLIISSVGCNKWQHKYPEDSERTKDTPIERLTNKWWVLSSAKINGIESSDSIFQIFGKYKIYFSQNIENITLKNITVYTGLIHTKNEPSFATVWSFSGDEYLGIGPLNGNVTGKVSFVPGYENRTSYDKWLYTILKLSQAEFKISIVNIRGDSIITHIFEKE